MKMMMMKMEKHPMCCWFEVIGVISTTDHHKSATGPAWNHQQTHVFMFRRRKWKRWGHLNFSFPFLLNDSVAGIKARAHPVLQMLEESIPFDSTFIFFWHRVIFTLPLKLNEIRFQTFISPRSERVCVCVRNRMSVCLSGVCGMSGVWESVCLCVRFERCVCERESVCLCISDTDTLLSVRITLSCFFQQNQHHVFPDSSNVCFCSNYTDFIQDNISTHLITNNFN